MAEEEKIVSVDIKFKFEPKAALEGIILPSEINDFKVNLQDFEEKGLVTFITTKIDDSTEKIADRAKKILNSVILPYTLEKNQVIDIIKDQITEHLEVKKKNTASPINYARSYKLLSINAVLVAEYDEVSFQKALLVSKIIYEDEFLENALFFYKKALRNREEALSNLSKAIECIEKTGLSENCDVNTENATRIMNNNEIITGRHSKGNNIRPASKEEIDTCFTTTRKLIQGYLQLKQK